MSASLPPDSLALVCPRCRGLDPHTSALVAHPLRRESNGRVAVAGALAGDAVIVCANPHCAARYPVLDGVAVVFAQPGALSAGDNLPVDLLSLSAPALAALASDCDERGAVTSTLARLARHARAGFGDWLTGGPDEPTAHPPHAVSLMRWLAGHDEAARCRALDGPRGVLGAALGREAWAEPTTPTLLVDAWLPGLLAARRLAREGCLELVVPLEPGRWQPVRIEVPAGLAPATPLALLCCDAADPPLYAGCLASVIASNLVDSVAEPYLVLGQAAALRAAGGLLTVSSPFTWRPEVTQARAWLSRLAPAGGSSEDGLLAVLREVAPELAPHARTELDWALPNGAREHLVYRSIARLFAEGGAGGPLV